MFTREVTLWCDGEDCPEWATIPTNQVKIARDKAKAEYGWKSQHGKDYCHKCATSLSEKSRQGDV